MNPAEALRLSRARTLATKHTTDLAMRWPLGESFVHGTGYEVFTFDLAQLAALIDEATATKDATIAALRSGMTAGYIAVDGDGTHGLFSTSPTSIEGGPPREWKPVSIIPTN